MQWDIFSLETWFWFLAIAGTAAYAIRILLSVVLGVDHDLEFDADAIGHGSTDSLFGIFSATSLMGFAMLFGWGGLTALKQFELGSTLSLIFAFLCGLLALFLTVMLGRMLAQLKSEGSVFNIENTVGLSATVYQAIRNGTTGKIQISVDGLLHELDALADENLNSGVQVKVVGVVSPVLVKVERLKD